MATHQHLYWSVSICIIAYHTCNTIDILDYVNGIGNGRLVLNHAIHSYASRLCWSDQRLREGHLLHLGRRVGVAKSFLWGRAESSEHGSMNFCAFCLSTITGY